MKRLRAYYDFARAFTDFDDRPPPEPHGKALIISLMDDAIEGAKFEAFFVKSIQMRGYRPFILTSRGGLANRVFRKMGINDFIYFQDEIDIMAGNSDQLKVLQTMLSDCATYKEVLALSYKNVNIGKYACSTALRQHHAGEIELDSYAFRQLISKFLTRTILNTDAATRILDRVKPEKILFLERGYSPYGEFFDIGVQRGLDVLQWAGCHSNKAVMLKRYTPTNRAYHPSSLSGQSWEALKACPWNQKRGDLARKELFANYSSGDWFSEVGTQFNTQITEQNDTRQKLGLDPDKKTAVIFAHILWDATFFYGVDLFADYKEWLVETVRAAVRNDSVNWIIKVHPANIVKKERENYEGQWAEITAVEEALGNLPDHIRWLEPDSKISTYSLFSIMDYCITVRGTVGIEAAAFGVPVLTAGTGRYDRYGFTVDSGSIEEYLDKCLALQQIPPLSAHQKELAQKFAYGIFCARPFPLNSISIHHNRDKQATLSIQYHIKSTSALSRQEDFKKFGDWVDDCDLEDYLDQSELQKLESL